MGKKNTKKAAKKTASRVELSNPDAYFYEKLREWGRQARAKYELDNPNAIHLTDGSLYIPATSTEDIYQTWLLLPYFLNKTLKD